MKKYSVQILSHTHLKGRYYFCVNSWEEALKIARLESIKINQNQDAYCLHGGEFGENSFAQFGELINLVVSGSPDFSACIYDTTGEFSKQLYIRGYLSPMYFNGVPIDDGEIYEKFADE